MLQIIAPAAEASQTAQTASSVDGIAMVTPPQPAPPDGSDYVMLQAMPTVDPSDAQIGTILDTLRADLPPSGALVGGAPAENLDLQQALNDYFPLIVGIILVLGFVLLLVALQAPLIAVLGTVVSLLSTAAAFGGREVDLPGRARCIPARLHSARLPRRLGAGVLLRNDLRDRHGLHRVPPRHGKRTLRTIRGRRSPTSQVWLIPDE